MALSPLPLVVRQGRPALQVALDLLGVLPKGALDLLVEVGIAIIDEINILIRMVRPPTAELGSLVLLGLKLHHHAVHILLHTYNKISQWAHIFLHTQQYMTRACTQVPCNAHPLSTLDKTSHKTRGLLIPGI
jgi:hypothetical protein